jgi:hypothetical protein
MIEEPNFTLSHGTIVEIIPNCEKQDINKYTVQYILKYGVHNVYSEFFIEQLDTKQEIESFSCSHCDKIFTSNNGKLFHELNWCAKNPKNNDDIIDIPMEDLLNESDDVSDLSNEYKETICCRCWNCIVQTFVFCICGRDNI